MKEKTEFSPEELYEKKHAFARFQDCKYRAFNFIITNEKDSEEFRTNTKQYQKFILGVYNALKQEEVETNTKILLDDKNNKPFNFDVKMRQRGFYNPIVLDDSITFYVNEKSITPKRMNKIFLEQLKENDIPYSFYSNTTPYETNRPDDDFEKYSKGDVVKFYDYYGYGKDNEDNVIAAETLPLVYRPMQEQDMNL